MRIALLSIIVSATRKHPIAASRRFQPGIGYVNDRRPIKAAWPHNKKINRAVSSQGEAGSS